MFRILVALAAFGIAQPCLAWRGDEHVTIGESAFALACARARTEAWSSLDSDARQRLDLICSEVRSTLSSSRYVRFAYTELMGEWSALAADHTRLPTDLTDIRLGDVAIDYRVLTRVAMTNYRHFHPAAPVSWRGEHLKAVASAVQAAKAAGANLVEDLERALAVEAFAQHYLQDSFASGHMGFNRVASSNAATLAYHNELSSKGRCVANARGEAWYTYGDGKLNDANAPHAEERVVDAAAESLYDFIKAFVLAQSDPVSWLDTWSKLPAYFDDELDDPLRCNASRSWSPLRTVSKVAHAALTFEVSTVADTSIYQPAARAIMIGASHEFVFGFPFGYRTIQNRIFVALGTTVTEIGERRSYVGQYGYVWHVGTSVRGLLSHEVGFGQFFFYAPKEEAYRTYRNNSIHLLYAMNVELGQVYVRFLGGPSSAAGGGEGFYAGVALGWVGRSGKLPD